MRLFIGVIALLPLMAAADTAYVTDNLRLGLHEAEDTSDRAFRVLESGQPMEVLLRAGNYANVRLPDGTEGWVKTGYLVDEKPAKLIVAETMAERDAVAAELAEAKAAFAEPAAAIERLQNEATDLKDPARQRASPDHRTSGRECIDPGNEGKIPGQRPVNLGWRSDTRMPDRRTSWRALVGRPQQSQTPRRYSNLLTGLRGGDRFVGATTAYRYLDVLEDLVYPGLGRGALDVIDLFPAQVRRKQLNKIKHVAP